MLERQSDSKRLREGFIEHQQWVFALSLYQLGDDDDSLKTTRSNWVDFLASNADCEFYGGPIHNAYGDIIKKCIRVMVFIGGSEWDCLMGFDDDEGE